jgi:NTP pyrophosphatase (non-canonical NTP hydrolase)
MINFNDDDRDKIYKKLEEQNGRNYQLTVCVEELAELQKEISKQIRGENNIRKIAEEVSDVLICLDQLDMFFDLKESIEFYVEYKLKRLEKFYINKENK